MLGNTARCSAISALLLAALTLPPTVAAKIVLPGIISDHAVLQRQAPIHLWGWAEPNETITAHFHQQAVTAHASSTGEWTLWLMPEPAGGPYTLTINGSSTVMRNDLLVGDVWFASGQSNMEMPLQGFPPQAFVKDADQEISAANLPQVRLLRVEHNSSEVPLNDIKATWTTCTPQTAAKFSAVAYFFGRQISAREHVPIGLIDATWGGTPIESWISLEGIASDSSLMPLFASRARFAKDQSRMATIQAAEKQQDAEALAAHRPMPVHPWHPDPASWQPAGLFNGMIAPTTPYSIKGVLWYQGETNSAKDRAPLYAKLFPELIADWRRQWQQGDFPFLFVQISSFNSPTEDWGVIRDAQRRTLSVDNTAMAVSIDVGNPDNVHPSDKQTVADRLALAAQTTVYGKPGEYSGPLYRQTTREGNSLRVWFDHAKGLNSKGNTLIGFEVAGDNHHFVSAQAVIHDDSVAVSSPSVAEPRYVRYAWPNATQANLYNSSGLPASTFTSE